ncbi:hypothetical protein ASPACDRAFT_64078 [Aspergillus aculeatus ATCC 16872]|uniref:Uncharacterized protein n=1 Tax=Aspergillus aculeatus (strain ATCC 16872 / CBS 172.66 / WB 5094) TaxID=690307 RepID=A0A1L9WHC7_ASPA1|nr:uncharacterized protein ASPACDRAFT_64078 [Aspergillus aculeatus ATCC 16872]OJJ95579.1 hypothetical protein ASPACDRAFT_64078 [Aspergillus aculeatus ATCC 16872]
MVYAHYIAAGHYNAGGTTPYYVWLFISADRNTADNLFRILYDKQGTTLTVPPGPSYGAVKFTPQNVKRLSPRFWSVDVGEGNPEAISALGAAGAFTTGIGDKSDVFAPISGKVLCYWMGAYASGMSRILPELERDEEDFDVLSGYSFFVRRRGYPTSYWYCDGSMIYLSDTKRSRFTVAITDAGGKPWTPKPKERVPLIHSDHVAILWSNTKGKLLRVGLDDQDNGLIVSKGDDQTFTFRDFSNRFYLQDRDVLQDQKGPTVQGVCWSDRLSFQDSFEVCYGSHADEYL